MLSYKAPIERYNIHLREIADEIEMIRIGGTYELDVLKTVNFGFYLDAKDLGEVLLPKKHAPQDLSPGDSIEVFLYLDSENRPIATTQKPKAQVGEFAYLRAVATAEVGAFLDWGLDKDVLLPFAEQHRPIEVGHSYLVYLYLDKIDSRITASSKIDKFLSQQLLENIKELSTQKIYKDPKSIFQEIAQSLRGITPHYEIIKETGPDHQKIFEVAVFVGKKKIARGNGPSKQKAEEDASIKATKILNNPV